MLLIADAMRDSPNNPVVGPLEATASAAGYRANPPMARVSAAATSSLAELEVERFTSRVFPASSFLTCAADKLAINKALEFSSTDSGPSFAPFRRARMSLAASLHLVTLGSSGAPGPMASCRSVSRKRSQITNAGIPHAPLTNSHK